MGRQDGVLAAEEQEDKLRESQKYPILFLLILITRGPLSIPQTVGFLI